MRTKMSIISAVAIVSVLLMSSFAMTAGGSDATSDETYAMTPSDAMEMAFQGTGLDSEELSVMIDDLMHRVKGIADVKMPSLAQVISMLADVFKRGSGSLIIDGEYTFDKDVYLHRLYIKDGSVVTVSPGVSVKTDKLYINTSGGSATFSTGEGASISFGDLFIENIPVPLCDVTVTTESTTISSSCRLSNRVLSMSLVASYSDSLNVFLKKGSVTYRDGDIDLFASLDFKRILDPQFKIAVSISGSNSSSDGETPFYIENLDLRMESMRRMGGGRDVDMTLSLGRVMAGPVDNLNMKIDMSFPLPSMTDDVYSFNLNAQSIHVNQLTQNDSLQVDVKGLTISMWSGATPGFFLGYDSLSYNEWFSEDSMTMKRANIKDVFISFQGEYKDLISSLKKGSKLVSVSGTVAVKSNYYHEYSFDACTKTGVMVKSSELDGLDVQFVFSIPTDIKLKLDSYEYWDDSGVELSWNDIDYEIILFGDDPKPSLLSSLMG